MNLTLSRIGSTPWGTLGHLAGPGFRCVTMEREWAGNAKKRSCIPAGTYHLTKRSSSVVYRSTKGKYLNGWEVTDVPGRSLIMIHPGNWQHDVEGCIAPGRAFSILERKVAVSHSLAAFTELMKLLEGEKEHILHVRWIEPEEENPA